MTAAAQTLIDTAEAQGFAARCEELCKAWRSKNPTASGQDWWAAFRKLIAQEYDRSRPTKPLKGAGQRRVDGEPTGIMVRIGAIMGRRASTRWTKAEVDALDAADPQPEDIETMEAYYQAKLRPDQDIRRRDLPQLLNNWAGECDRARAWYARAFPGSGGRPMEPAGTEPKGWRDALRQLMEEESEDSIRARLEEEMQKPEWGMVVSTVREWCTKKLHDPNWRHD